MTSFLDAMYERPWTCDDLRCGASYDVSRGTAAADIARHLASAEHQAALASRPPLVFVHRRKPLLARLLSANVCPGPTPMADVSRDGFRRCVYCYEIVFEVESAA
jgi:hypothetical protein